MVVACRVSCDMVYWIMAIYVQTIAGITVQHVTRDDMIDLDIALKIKSFDKALTERLDDTKFIIGDFNSFGIKDEGSDMP